METRKSLEQLRYDAMMILTSLPRDETVERILTNVKFIDDDSVPRHYKEIIDSMNLLVEKLKKDDKNYPNVVSLNNTIKEFTERMNEKIDEKKAMSGYIDNMRSAYIDKVRMIAGDIVFWSKEGKGLLSGTPRGLPKIRGIVKKEDTNTHMIKTLQEFGLKKLLQPDDDRSQSTIDFYTALANLDEKKLDALIEKMHLARPLQKGPGK